MGRRGPAPTPTAILNFRGSKRAKTRTPEPEPEATAADTKPPKLLDKHAKAKWKELVPRLARLQCLTDVDLDALVVYCEAWSTWTRMTAWLHEHGETFVIRDKDGKIKFIQQVPQVAIARAAAGTLRALGHEFGLTPAARVGLPGASKRATSDNAQKTSRFVKVATHS